MTGGPCLSAAEEEREMAGWAFPAGGPRLGRAVCRAGVKRRRRREGAGPAAGLGRKRERKGKEKKEKFSRIVRSLENFGEMQKAFEFQP